MAAILLSVVVILALVYFFRPSTFNFLKMTQGFEDDDLDEDFEDYDDDVEEDFEDYDDDVDEDFEDYDDDVEDE